MMVTGKLYVKYHLISAKEQKVM